MNPLLTLAAKCRSDADRYERDNALVRGDAIRLRVAGELEAAWRDWQEEALTFTQAAEESGYAADSIGRLVREGKIVAAKGRVKRCDLPRKPRVRNGVTTSNIVNCKEQIARSVANSSKGERDG